MHNHSQNAKSKKGRVVILVRNTSSRPVLHFYQVPSKYSEGYLSYRADRLSISNKTKGNNSKSKQARFVILVRDTSSRPVLHFYQVPSKYSEGYLSYRANRLSISNKTKGNNSKSKQARVVILVRDTSSCPVLYFYQVLSYQVSSKYSKRYSSYRADTKSMHNYCQI